MGRVPVDEYKKNRILGYELTTTRHSMDETYPRVGPDSFEQIATVLNIEKYI